MQYYIYNNNDSQNEYQKVYVDGIQAKDRQITIGKQLFEIFTTFSKQSPLGALPLNGYTIYNCDEKLPQFWDECVRRKKAGTIPVTGTLDDWNELSDEHNGNVGVFWIDETNKTVKLPCLNTVVLTNIDVPSSLRRIYRRRK